jgi:glycosyltransferase involved in cell wall biosynthesis
MPRRPRVLLASRIFTPEAAAASFRLRALVRGLRHTGAEVTVLTASAPPGHEVEDEPEVVVHRRPVLRDANGYVRGYLPYLSFDVPLAVRLLLVRRPDVVVVEPPPTTGAVVRVVTAVRSVRRRLPYVYYAADIWSDATASTGAPGWVVATLRALEQFALRGARDVVAVSEGVAERATVLAGGRPVHVVPNGVDTDVFTPEPAAPETGADLPDPADGPFLLYAGTASEWQGAEVFAEAMRQVVLHEPGARLVFLGQGSSWPALQRVAADLPEGAIELRRLVPAARAAQWHRAAAAALVSVKPGLGYDFAYPTKVLAALACGTPVVFAGPGPAAADLTAHGLGEAVPYDVDAVAAAMLRALRAQPDPDASRHRADWVREHRSLQRTGEAVAAVVLAGVPGPETVRSRR